jgi:flagellar basal-body rod modification protein FlgD
MITTAIGDIPTVKEKGFREPESAEGRIKRQKMEFFKLLTAQLKNQDPLDPMDTTEMTNQIFQINHVEQQLNANKIAEETLAEIKKLQHTNVLHYIDAIVEFPGNSVQAYGGKAVFGYDMPADVKEAKIRIFDEKGRVVHSTQADSKMGYHQFIWDKPSHCPDGIYRFAIDAKDKNDETLTAKTFGLGRVDSVVNKEGKNYLEVMQQMIPLDGYHKIRSGAGIEALLLTEINDKIAQLQGTVSEHTNKAPKIAGASDTVPINDQQVIEKLKNDPKILDAIKAQLKTT